MKETTTAATLHDAATPSGKRGRPRGQSGAHRDLGEGASAEAKRLAAAILEVLAGARTPTDAAQTLGLSLPRYYLLEDRALHGMLVACEPRTIGRGPSPESALAALRRECDQLRRECGRQQALVRAAQRTIGLAPPTPPARGPERDGKKRRRRRPTARALRAAAQLKKDDGQAAVAVTAATAASA
jgi:hypothetical protein